MSVGKVGHSLSILELDLDTKLSILVEILLWDEACSAIWRRSFSGNNPGCFSDVIRFFVSGNSPFWRSWVLRPPMTFPFSTTSLGSLHVKQAVTGQQWCARLRTNGVCQDLSKFEILVISSYFVHLFSYDLWSIRFFWTFHDFRVSAEEFGAQVKKTKNLRTLLQLKFWGDMAYAKVAVASARWKVAISAYEDSNAVFVYPVAQLCHFSNCWVVVQDTGPTKPPQDGVWAADV